MADIELVVKMPEGLKKDFELEQWTALSCMEMKNALEKATQLPKGHGRLIDASNLLTVTDYDGENEKTYVLYDEIDNAPTIIGADKAESIGEGMTREEAINQLKDAKVGYEEYLSIEAIDMAIKALDDDSYIFEKMGRETRELKRGK